MSYRRNYKTTETPAESANRIFKMAMRTRDPLVAIVGLLAVCEWRDSRTEKEFQEFVQIVADLIKNMKKL